MLADGRRAAAILERRRAEFRERTGIGDPAAEFGMFEGAPVAARFELRTLHHFLDRRDRRHQKAALHRKLEQLRLGVAAREVHHDLLDALELAERLGAAEQLIAERDPVLVARRLIAEAARANIFHQLAREDAERRTEQEGERD